MRTQPRQRWIAILILCGLSGTAAAHPGHDLSGFAAGVSHPFTGLDHLLAMVAVGLWAARSGPRKAWMLPATFMLSMVAGAGLSGLTRYPLSVETGIAASVLVLGLVTALSLQVPAVLAMAITALSGALHGFAHGLEIPASAAPVTYALGFLVATAALHAGGVAIGLLPGKRFTALARVAGVGIALSGAWMLSGSVA
jgi:urease accessory protein